MDYTQEFKNAIAALGIVPPDHIKPDGNINRFSSNGKPNDRSGWYRYHDDDIPGGTFGCFRADISSKWFAKTKQEFTPEEKQAWQKRMKEAEAEREAQRLAALEQAAADAARMWKAGLDADHPNATHPYLTRKQIPLLGAKILNGMVLIQIKQGKDKVVGLQRIWPDGTKRPVVGTPMQGSYTTIGKVKDSAKVVICEGWATGVSIHLATGYCVVVAFTAGNLKPVADKITALLPGKEVVVAADDDAWTVYPTNHPKAGQPWNPGLEAAYATGLPVYIPRWYGDREEGWTDFNDLHVSEGLGAVKECFEEAVPPPAIKAEPAVVGEPVIEPVIEPGDGVPDYIDETPSDGLTPAELAEMGRQTPDGPTLIFSTSPMQTAEKFAETMPGGGRIIFWRGEFYAWDGCRYALQERIHIEQRLYRFMAQCWTEKKDAKTGEVSVIPFNPKRNLVDDVYHALRAVCFADLPEPQCWIDEHQADWPAHEIIAFKNGFLHWPTRKLMKATDRLFVINVLDFEYTPDAGQPVEWLKFMGNLWPDDAEAVDALSEMFGYLLTDDNTQQKMFMLIGPPRSGKGTILRVLESLVGYHNRVSPSMISLGTQFGLQPLIGKRVAMISDARLSGRADQQPIIETMLKISGEDSVTVPRKHIGDWSGKLPTRFVMASNELPGFNDASSALANRFILFKFNTSFLGREDHGLTSRLLKELPAIVLWALDGLTRLHQRGYLLNPASSDELAQDLIEQTSPVRTFVNERCKVGDDTYTVDKDDLFKEWKLWCAEQGRDHCGTKMSFGRQLSAAFSCVKRHQPRVSGTRLNQYQGIRLKLHFETD